MIPTSANAVICEVHRTWNRPDAAELAELYCVVSPSYRVVMESNMNGLIPPLAQRDSRVVVASDQPEMTEIRATSR